MHAAGDQVPAKLLIRPPEARSSKLERMETAHAMMHPRLLVELIKRGHFGCS